MDKKESYEYLMRNQWIWTRYQNMLSQGDALRSTNQCCSNEEVEGARVSTPTVTDMSSWCTWLMSAISLAVIRLIALWQEGC